MMRKRTDLIRPWLRFLAFFLVPAAILVLCNQVLIAPHESTFYTFYELSQRDDVEMAVVGSSVVQYGFNANVITEDLGMEVYNVTAGHMAMPGSLAATQIMYKTNQPRYVCLVLEPDSFGQLSENMQTQQMLQPFMLDPKIGIPYYLDLCKRDGKYFERLFIFRSYMAKDLDEVQRMIRMRLDPETYYAESEFGRTGYYKGRGYITKEVEGQGEGLLRFVSLRPVQDNAISPELSEESKRQLIQYRDLCEKQGSQLIVVMPPNMLAHALAKDGYAQKHVSLEAFCKEQGIAFFNFFFAKESFMPRLDHYFEDVLHMDYRGAEMFSHKFAEVMQMYMDGRPTDHLFYHSAEEFFDSIDCITNTWIEETRGHDQDVYMASCMSGASVTPEYSFYLVAEDGTKTLLQPYSQSDTFTCAAGEMVGQRLRVYARPLGSEEESVIFYDVICGQ